MRRVLVDTGPLVALLSRRDAHHTWARRLFDTLTPPLHTCDAVITESCLLLRSPDGGPDAVMEMVARGIVRSEFSVAGEVDALRGLMQKYRDVPMSLADACLVRMTDLDRDSVVVTLDSGFDTYRRGRNRPVPTISPGSEKR